MLLDAALDGAANQHERDSIESIAVTKRTTHELFRYQICGFGIQNKRHPMPLRPCLTSRFLTAILIRTLRAKPQCMRMKTTGVVL